MLNRLQLSNFKAWLEADIEFAKVTGFFGTNSAGKSSLLQFLLLLKQTRDATDRGLVLDFGGPNEIVNLGTFEDVVHRREAGERIRWRLDWTLPHTLKIEDPLGTDPLWEGETLQTRCEVGRRRQKLWPFKLTYRFDGTEFSLTPKEESSTQFELVTDDDFQFVRNRGRPWPIPRPIKTYLFPSESRIFFQNTDFLGEFELEYEKLMDSIFYLGPLREHPQREYQWAGSRPVDVGQRGERTVDAILAATRDGDAYRRSLGYRKRSKSFQEMIAYWLNELGLIYDFSIDEVASGSNLYRALVKQGAGSVPVALTDVGFGVSQILPVLVLLYYVPEGATVVLEQPEIHLHPALQSGLADVMLNVAEARDIQIIVESHSEHLLRRLQRRVAEEHSRASDVKLYFVSTAKGRAQAADLALNEWGEIENWPDKFFGDEVGEITAITRAALDRRRAQRE